MHKCVQMYVHSKQKRRCLKTKHGQACMVCEQVRYPEALNYFLSADVKAIKKTLNKSKPVHRMASCFMRMQKVRLKPACRLLAPPYYPQQHLMTLHDWICMLLHTPIIQAAVWLLTCN